MRNFWWGHHEENKRFTRFPGKSCVNQKLKGVWGLEIFKNSTMLCWQNKSGGSCTTQTPCSMLCSEQNSSHMAMYWMPRTRLGDHMPGPVFDEPFM